MSVPNEIYIRLIRLEECLKDQALLIQDLAKEVKQIKSVKIEQPKKANK